jgi:hypothetical protein
MHARFAPLLPLFFVFAVFGRVDGQRAVRVVSACNRRASNEQRAIRAASGYNTRASIRLSVFVGVHAFSCCHTKFYGN